MSPSETASLFDPAAENPTPPQSLPRTRVEPGHALAEAARDLTSVLEAGHRLTAPVVTTALHDAWRRLDPAGRSWNSKLCYDAAEAATVLFLRRWAPGMREQADTPLAFLAMVERIASLEPTHTHRSEHQVAFDQFSTPLALACAAFLAADVRPGDTVLEPSAGTGVLAALPATVLDDPTRLVLNELSPVRHALLAEIYPDASVTKHNAEHIRDRLPRVRPDVVLMNPPFAARPALGKRQRHVDLKHLKSAYAALTPCGRLVAVTGANCIPESTAWRDAFGSGPGRAAHPVRRPRPAPDLPAPRHGRRDAPRGPRTRAGRPRRPLSRPGPVRRRRGRRGPGAPPRHAAAAPDARSRAEGTDHRAGVPRRRHWAGRRRHLVLLVAGLVPRTGRGRAPDAAGRVRRHGGHRTAHPGLPAPAAARPVR